MMMAPVRCLHKCALLAISLLAFMASGQEKPKKNSSRECAICHIRWIEAFGGEPVEGVKSLHGREEGTREMCMSCHDGAVMDSRLKLGSTKHHTTNEKPSSKITLTDEFKLDDNGALTCTTCHSAHALKEDSFLGMAIFLREPNVNSSICVKCHSDRVETPGYHHLIGKMQTSVPEVILKAGGKFGENNKVIVCQTCHNVHGGEYDWLVLSSKELCAGCHSSPAPQHAKEACVSCHYIHLDPKMAATPGWILSKTKENPLLRKQKSQLCVECHEKDLKPLRKSHDPMAFQPEVQKALNLNDSIGKCRVCHTVHLSDSPEKNSKKTAKNGYNYTVNCMNCHSNPAVSKDFKTNHPTAVAIPAAYRDPSYKPDPKKKTSTDTEQRMMGCSSCHSLHDDTEYAHHLRLEPDELCISCHKDKVGVDGSKHDPRVAEWGKKKGITKAVQCIDCHPVHGEWKTKGIWAGLTGLPDEDTPSCQSCHRQGGLGPVVALPPHMNEILNLGEKASRAITCSDCHNIHDKTNPTYLLTGARADSSICLKCHAEKKEVLGTAHDRTTDKANPLNRRKETPAVSGVCGTCHLIHPVEDSTWAQKDGPGNAPGDTHCTACHDKGSHANHTTETYIDNADKVLMSPDPKKPGSKEEIVRCIVCHDAHHSYVHKKSEKYQCRIKEKFLRKEVHEGLCVRCHNRPMNTQEGKKLSDFSKDIQDFEYPHSPAKNGDCVACHQAHISKDPLLLGMHVSEKMYNSFDVDEYALCFSCHCPDKVLLKETKDATEFRNKSKNLHYLHVNQEKKGRGCKVCHDMHGSNYPAHVRKELEFGEWKMPVGLQRTPKGGTCETGCHKKTTYERIPSPVLPRPSLKMNDPVPDPKAAPKK